jgi:hypothetical protein
LSQKKKLSTKFDDLLIDLVKLSIDTAIKDLKKAVLDKPVKKSKPVIVEADIILDADIETIKKFHKAKVIKK